MAICSKMSEFWDPPALLYSSWELSFWEQKPLLEKLFRFLNHFWWFPNFYPEADTLGKASLSLKLLHSWKCRKLFRRFLARYPCRMLRKVRWRCTNRIEAGGMWRPLLLAVHRRNSVSFWSIWSQKCNRQAAVLSHTEGLYGLVCCYQLWPLSHGLWARFPRVDTAPICSLDIQQISAQISFWEPVVVVVFSWVCSFRVSFDAWIS